MFPANVGANISLLERNSVLTGLPVKHDTIFLSFKPDVFLNDFAINVARFINQLLALPITAFCSCKIDGMHIKWEATNGGREG